MINYYIIYGEWLAAVAAEDQAKTWRKDSSPTGWGAAKNFRAKWRVDFQSMVPDVTRISWVRLSETYQIGEAIP